MITWRELGKEIAKMSDRELDFEVTICDFNGDYFGEDMPVDHVAFDHLTLDDTRPLLMINLGFTLPKDEDESTTKS